MEKKQTHTMKIELSSKDGKYKIYTETNNMKQVKDVKEYLRNTVYQVPTTSNKNNILVFYNDLKIEDSQSLESFSRLHFQFEITYDNCCNEKKEFFNETEIFNKEKNFSKVFEKSELCENSTLIDECQISEKYKSVEESKLIEECKLSMNSKIIEECFNEELKFDSVKGNSKISKKDKVYLISNEHKIKNESKTDDLNFSNLTEKPDIKTSTNFDNSNKSLIKIRLLQDNSTLHVDPNELFIKNNKMYLIKERHKIINLTEIYKFFKNLRITKNDLIRILIFTFLLMTNNNEIFFLVACVYILQVFSKFILKISKESMNTLKKPFYMFFMSLFIIDYGRVITN